MRAIAVFLLGLIAGMAIGSARAEGPILYRNAGPALMTSSCDLPIAREDGKTLLITEIKSVNLYVVQSLTQATPAPVVVDTALACQGDIDLTKLSRVAITRGGVVVAGVP